MKINNFEPSDDAPIGCCELCVHATVPPRDEPCASCKWLDLEVEEGKDYTDE